MKNFILHSLAIFAIGFFMYANYGLRETCFVIVFYILYSSKDFLFSKIKYNNQFIQFLKQKTISLSFLGGIIIGLILSILLLLFGAKGNFVFFTSVLFSFLLCLCIQYSFFVNEKYEKSL